MDQRAWRCHGGIEITTLYMNDWFQQILETHLVFALLPAMLRPLRGPIHSQEHFTFVVRPKTPDPIGKCFFYGLVHLLCIVVLHLLDKMIDKNMPSRDIPRWPWFPHYINHEVSSCGVTSLCTMPCVLPLSQEPGNLRRFRCASIGWVLLKEVVKFTSDQFLDQIQSAQKCVI